ncbi:PilC/PilY family type IV pilus protein [Polaromonas sp.]|uniref:pilus assembly protein n=1 Tax=Polaromonas sp. TaxID=1869339 RepID=UPI003266CA44
MFFLLPSVRSLVLSTAIAMLLVQLVAAQAPAQKPLLSRDGGGVKPNILLTMDDSGSMMFQHMPEDNIILGSQIIRNPVGGNSVRMDPDDNATLGGPGSAQGNPVQYRGTISGDPASQNYRQKMLRSSDTNTIYYNPEVRYRPWPLVAGGRMPNATVTAARRDPMSATGGTIDLTNVRTIANAGLVWCYQPLTGVVGAAAEGACGANISIAYDPGLYYRLNKSTSGAYLGANSPVNYQKFSINDASTTTYTASPARTDCSATSCSRTQERQNFANWFTYYRTRNLLARGAVAEAFSESADTFRLGYGRINHGESLIDGVNTHVIQAGVRDFTGTRKGELFDWLYSLPAVGGTPLRLAVQEAGEYFSRADSRGPWAESPGTASSGADKTCRRAYHLLVTDGYWSDQVGSNGLETVGNQDDADGTSISGPLDKPYRYKKTAPYRDDASDTLADYAMKFWKNDLRPDLTNKVVSSPENPAFWQHMVNFTVGLGVRGSLDPATDLPLLAGGSKSWGSDAIDDLWHAAVNSRGKFFSAKDPGEMAGAIRDSIGQALQRELREGGVATASNQLEEGNRAYVPSYKTGVWSGDVQARAVGAGPDAPPFWSAEARMPAWGSRKIFTWDAGLTKPKAVPFTWSDMSTGNRTALGSAGNSAMVDFLRGNRAQEGSDQPFRRRAAVLGDFINSNPLLIKAGVNLGYGNLPTSGGEYAKFLEQKAKRGATLFIGSNGGMLHAFKDTLGKTPAEDGREVFAFVPRATYSNLSKLSDKAYGTDQLYHQFFVDGPLRETDAYVRAPGESSASWRNYLLGTLGAGGRAVYALDVTDTADLGATTVRWEFSNTNDADLGHVYSAVESGVLPNGQWVAIFGNGHMSVAGKAVLFVANLETGAVQKLVVDSSGSNGLSGVAVQRNSQGQITTLYAGDLKGQLWKFAYNAAAASRFEISDGAPLFSATSVAGVPQPITQPPGIYEHRSGGKMLIFGTGILVTETDANSTSVQAIYGVWDKPADVGFARPIARSSLAARALSSTPAPDGNVVYDVKGDAVDFVTQRGWVIDLDVLPGLRMINPIVFVSKGVALVHALAPGQNVVPCEASPGAGITFVLPVASGANPSYRLFDTNGDGFVNGDDSTSVGYSTSPGGQKVFLPDSSPNGGGGGPSPCPPGFKPGLSLDQASGGKLVCVPGEPFGITDRVWRRIINPPIL